jgi:hypothetical protein
MDDLGERKAIRGARRTLTSEKIQSWSGQSLKTECCVGKAVWITLAGLLRRQMALRKEEATRIGMETTLKENRGDSGAAPPSSHFTHCVGAVSQRARTIAAASAACRGKMQARKKKSDDER